MGNEIGWRLVPFARHAEFIVDHTLIKKPLLKFTFFPFIFYFLHVQICVRLMILEYLSAARLCFVNLWSICFCYSMFLGM